MPVYKIEPLRDHRWEDFLDGEHRASVFHTTGWLEALQRAYGYQPIVYTTSSPGTRLRNGVVFCQIESWLTGRRLVSLPFSDYCEPLVDNPEDLQSIWDELTAERNRSKTWRYIEVRSITPLKADSKLFHSTYEYAIHRLNLSPSLDQIFNAFHKNSTQRKIRRAEREGLAYADGCSESLLSNFYQLLVVTRRRLGIPPQPLKWFRYLIASLGDALRIRVAFKESRPIAAILTIRRQGTLVYKYGCSNENFHNLGGMHLLLWRSIQEAKNAGLNVFDFGRSDCNNEGLIRFKERWGARRSAVTYSRYTTSSHSSDNYRSSEAHWTLQIVKRACTHAPRRLLSMAGGMLYRHVG